ncbi:MAG: NADH-dependent dehydrogenase [Gemmatales bacterium]|nr:MAG: NADH-dependent dehydrogenase [Gemmatales bacterium]
MVKTMTRRGFVETAASVTVASALAGRAVAANDKIGVAVIGVRGRGNALLQSFASQKDVAVTHICDVDRDVLERRGAETKSKGHDPKLVKDYRTILNDPSIDALVIGTPDHWHALPTIEGCLHKKDVYVEKPDGHNIIEGKTMVAAARKYGRVVQLGTQARSAPYLREAREYVAKGNLGKVIFGRAWETAKQSAVPRVKDSHPPDGVDYDLWLGPAPKRPFNANRFHGRWRWFFDYGTGDLGNDGVHRMDYCRYVMGLDGWFNTVSCSGGKYFFDDAQEWPDTMLVTFDYPGKVLTYEMRIWSGPKLFDITEGAAIYGDAGWLLIHNSGWKAFDSRGKLVVEKRGSGGVNHALHIRNFLDCVRDRKWQNLAQDIESGHISSVMCHAGNIAWRTGKKLRFNPETETFDDKDANEYLGREYRKGFELPTV